MCHGRGTQKDSTQAPDLPDRCEAELDVTFSIPEAEWGESPVRLLAWLVDEGEAVSAGENVAELGRPGVIGYATAPCAGKVHKGSVPVSSSIVAGDVLGWITSASRRAKK